LTIKDLSADAKSVPHCRGSALRRGDVTIIGQGESKRDWHGKEWGIAAGLRAEGRLNARPQTHAAVQLNS
jgi:hypothetical protein